MRGVDWKPPARDGLPWTRDEEEQVYSLYQKGVPKYEIGEHQRRTKESINARLRGIRRRK